MGEVEASHAIGLQLDEAWSYDCTAKVDILAVGGGCVVQDPTYIIRHHQISLHQLARYA
jgi:hypothetical protein